MALQKIKGMTASQGRDVNSLRVYKLSYINSVYLLPPSSHHNSIAANRLDKMKGVLANQSSLPIGRINKKLNSLTSQYAENDDDEDSQSSLNDCTIMDFLKGAQN